LWKRNTKPGRYFTRSLNGRVPPPPPPPEPPGLGPPSGCTSPVPPPPPPRKKLLGLVAKRPQLQPMPPVIWRQKGPGAPPGEGNTPPGALSAPVACLKAPRYNCRRGTDRTKKPVPFPPSEPPGAQSSWGSDPRVGAAGPGPGTPGRVGLKIWRANGVSGPRGPDFGPHGAKVLVRHRKFSPPPPWENFATGRVKTWPGGPFPIRVFYFSRRAKFVFDFLVPPSRKKKRPRATGPGPPLP